MPIPLVPELPDQATCSVRLPNQKMDALYRAIQQIWGSLVLTGQLRASKL
jgi:hypothetical protein